MSKDNYIFLDMDEVMLNRASWITSGSHEEEDCIDPMCVRLLDYVCKVAEAKVVICSTWRHGTDRTNEWWNSLFKRYGASSIDVVGRTCYYHSKPRGLEVMTWVEENAAEINKYVIIDDSSDFFTNQPHVQPEEIYGFRYEHALQALLILVPEHSDASFWEKELTIINNAVPTKRIQYNDY